MKFDDIRKLIDGLTSDMESLKDNNRSFKRTIDTESISGVIDISLDDEKPIPEEKFDHQPVIKDYRYWILKLDRYYINPAMRVGQLNTASLKMYAKLADRLEAELNKEGTTVARQVSKLRREGIQYDLYYTIYKIAETTVINHYNPLSTKTTSRSLEYLKKATSDEICEIIAKEASTLEGYLAEPSPETRDFFQLTANNKVSLWWDADGSLREKYGFNKEQELAINQISKRSNVLWRNDQARFLLMDMYLATLAGIFKNPDLASSSIISIVSPYSFSKLALDNILRITEARLRVEFTIYTTINTEKARGFVKEIQDGRLFDFIISFQNDFLEIQAFEINQIYETYFRNNPGKTKDYAKYLLSYDLDDIIGSLFYISDRADFDKLLNILVQEENPDVAIACLYFIYGLGIETKAHEKILFDIIREENFEDFLDLISNNDLDEDLIGKIKELKYPKLKKISVDTSIIDQSRAELKETVSMINQYLDDEQEEIEEVEPELDSSNPYKAILSKLSNEGSMTASQLEAEARKNGLTFNTFIGDINDSLYEYIGDQTLIVEGDRVVIDEFYIDMIKEYLNGN